MGLQVFWEDETRQIIRQVYDMTWTWDEYLAAFEKIRQLASEVDHPIGMIAELENIKNVPPNAVLYGARGIRSLPSNLLLTVMVTPSSLAHSLLKVILFAGQFENIVTAKSIEDAHRLIAAKNQR
ncbi:MAG: hypothetical protein LCI00_19820 [Chloroflexi bacterium]|nr:hypothetical protein [Chloroflexota bacterium]MCC6891351.1 hypothetical protein [Anaerolineae bacterium]